MQDAIVKRAADQRREAGHREYSKAVWIGSKVDPEMVFLARGAVLGGFVVTKCPAGKARNHRVDRKILAGNASPQLAIKKVEPWIGCWNDGGNKANDL